MEVVRTEPEELTGCHWMIILTTKTLVYKNARAMGNPNGCPVAPANAARHATPEHQRSWPSNPFTPPPNARW